MRAERRGGRARRAPWLALLACAAACRAEELSFEREGPRPARGMVVAEHAAAAEIGAAILERGGNAADAAVATALALAVVFPQAGNLGGGGLALWVAHGGEARLLDFRETAPQAARPELYLVDGRVAPERAREGVLSIGVPGTPAGLFELHAKLGSGRFTFEELAAPAIALARNGFEVDRRLAETLADESVRARLTANPAARELFYPGGEALGEGDRLVQGALADTLERYARRGPGEFVDGPTAAALVAEVDAQARLSGPEELGGRWITLGDLAAYRPVWRAPLRGWFRGHEVITAPPPSSGGLILLQALAILDGLPLEAERREALGRQAVAEDALADPAGLDARAVHWWIEALRRAFAERAEHLGDPDQHPVPLELLLSPAWVAQARLSIGERAEPEAVLPTPLPEGTETTHVSVLDPRGSAVSLTTTLNGAFGSAILVRGAGFLLNNELDDFALPEATPNQFALVGGEANRIAPFKRPLSSLTPTVLVGEGGAVALVLGGPGGPRIATSVLAVCLRLLAYGQSLEQAVAAPRLHQQWSPSATEFEPGWPPALLDELRRRGHEVREVEARFGGVQAIRVLPGGEVRGVSDPRRAGRAVPAERRREP